MKEPYCSAVKCKSRSENGVRFFRFPSDPERRKRWVINSRRDQWTAKSTSRLCEVNFISLMGLTSIVPNGQISVSNVKVMLLFSHLVIV